MSIHVQTLSDASPRYGRHAAGFLKVRSPIHPWPFIVEETPLTPQNGNRVRLFFRATPPAGTAPLKRSTFAFVVDVEEKKVIDPPETLPGAFVAGEFQAGLGKELGKLLRVRMDRALDGSLPGRSPDIPPYETGDLVSWATIAPFVGDLPDGARSAAAFFEFDSREWFADPQFCPNPRCDCREVVVEIFEEDIGQGSVRARVSPDGRFSEIDNDAVLNIDESMLLDAWWNSEPDLKEILAHRQALARRLFSRIAGGTPRPPRPAPDRSQTGQRSRPGRNSPCPCGSGKKFKHCCGGAKRK